MALSNVLWIEGGHRPLSANPPTPVQPVMTCQPNVTTARFGVPLYSDIEVHTESDNPFALVAAVRLAMRQARIGHPEIERFTQEALSGKLAAIQRVCREWVVVV